MFVDVRRSSHQLQHGCHLTAKRGNYTTLLLVQCVAKTVNPAVAGAPHHASQLSVFLHYAAQKRIQVLVFLRNLPTFGGGSNGFFLVHSVAVLLSCYPKNFRDAKRIEFKNQKGGNLTSDVFDCISRFKL